MYNYIYTFILPIQILQGEANQLLLLAGAAAEILQCGTGAHAKRKLKIIAGP